MMWTIIELFFTVIESFTKVYFFSKYFGIKKKRLHQKIIIFSAAVVVETLLVIIINQISVFEGLWGGAVYTAVSFFYCMVFLKGKPIIKFLACCCCEIFLALISFSVISILSTLSTQSFVEMITEQVFWRIIQLVVTKALFLFAVIVILRLKLRSEVYLSKYEWGIIITIFLCSLLIVLSIFEMVIQYTLTGVTGGLLFLTMGGLIAINVAGITLTVKIAKTNKENKILDMLNLKLEQQKKSIMEINDKYKKITKMRHDFKKYIECAATMIDNHDYDDAKKFLQKVADNKLPKVDDYVSTESTVLNALLNSKLSVCRDKGIETKCKILGSISDFSEIDFSIMLANLLDNAIEASENVEDPCITIDIYDRKSYKGVVITNKIKNSVLKDNPKLMSTKHDKSNHGIGIISIKDIVEKYNGMIDFTEHDDKFICSIMLKKRIDKKKQLQV